ncbi:MAG: hypothetical protein BGO65_04120 [Afipia sp. 64-13]|nr:MAG: hypothetical protein BGO65_04120 [Afipia sp. 64-13]
MIKHSVRLVQHFIIPETHHTKPLISQPAVTCDVRILPVVLATIDFDHQLTLETDKVSDIPPDHSLTLELDAL